MHCTTDQGVEHDNGKKHGADFKQSTSIKGQGLQRSTSDSCGEAVVTLAVKRFFKWYVDDISVSLRARSGSYGGGSEVLIIERRKKQ